MLHPATVFFFFGHIIYCLETLDLKKFTDFCHQLSHASSYFLISIQFREGKRSIYWTIGVDVIGSRQLTLFAMSLFFWLLFIVAIFEMVYYKLDLNGRQEIRDKSFSLRRLLCKHVDLEVKIFNHMQLLVSMFFFWHVIYHLEDLDN